MSRIMLGLAGATALGAALVVALPPPLPAPTPEVQVRPATARRVPSPPPTENFLDESAEREQKSRRKQWFRERHRAPEGVDWVAIERENGRVQLAKRNALAAEPPAPARWVERGSDNQAGRMHVIRHDPSDPDGLYAGSSLGGVWRGTRDGAGWTPIGDNLYGGAHWLEVYPGEADDPPIVLAATDWGSVHRSVDDGATWTVPEGFDAHDDIDRLLQLRDDDLTTFAIARSAEQWRVLRSTDAGASFQELWNLGVYEPDLWAPRDGGTTLYLAAQDHVWTSVDLGETWTELGAYAEGSQRAEITGSEAGAPRLYVMVNGERLAVSDDAGESFTPVDVEIWDYWGRLAASSEDPDLFTWGGVEVHITRDGAESFDIVNSWPEYYSAPETKLHADVMGLDVVPTDDGELWYVNTDGGPYVSEDGLRSVQNLGMRGLRVSQYYGTLSSARDSTLIAAGAQDQGWQVTNTAAQDDDLYEFDQLWSGDYAHLVSPDGTHDLMFAVYPGFMLVQIGEEEPLVGNASNFPSEEAGKYYAWLPPLTPDPTDADNVFLSATRLYRMERISEWAWYPVKWSEQAFDVDAYEYMSALAFDPEDPNRAWATTSYGRMYWSEDGAVTWTESTDRGPYAHWFHGTALWVSRTEADTLYAGGTGYGGPSVYRSTDAGRTWEAWDDGMPPTLVYSLVEAPDGSGTLFAGSETAAWRRDPGGAWEDITSNQAPVTIYWSAEALADENTIRFGTYGRGIWDYQIDPDNAGCWPVIDGDGDGWGCDVDCDDADDAIHPEADDPCDEVDQDCDPATAPTGDGDGDGTLACEDCDDGDDRVFPGATEVCGDDVDQDCDGEDPSCGTDAETPPADTAEDVKGSCGCGGSAPTGAWVLLGAAALVRRRRIG